MEYSVVSYLNDVYVLSKDGYTALMIASKGGHAECVRLLIAYKADVNYIANVSIFFE